MSLPKEGSREIDEGIIVSEAMDWCNSPLEPVPYRIWAKQTQATNLADSVRQTDERSHVKGSLVLASYGDEPGVGGGVTSGTTGADCTPKTWSETVLFEGRNAVRHDDEWWMNHKNTYGRLSYVKDQAEYPTSAPQAVDPKLQLAFYQAPGTATDAPTPDAVARAPTPQTAPDTETPGWGDFIWSLGKKAITSPMGKFGPAVGAFLTVMTPTPLNEGEDVRISEGRRKGCKIERYGNNTCVSGIEQSHHIVADTSMIVDGKRLLAKRNGLAICLRGNAAPPGSPNGHSVAQTLYNDETQKIASSPGNNGTLSLGEAERWGAQAAYRGAKADDPNTTCTPEYIQGILRNYHKILQLPPETRVSPGSWN